MGDYMVYFNKNAFAPFGAVDIDSNAVAPKGLSSRQCEDRCTADPACMCATWKRDDGTEAKGLCPKRMDIDRQLWFQCVHEDEALAESISSSASISNAISD